MTGFTEQSFAFLENLAANNDRDWFHANKATFQEKLESPFSDLLDALSNRLADALRPLSGGKSTMFRMNRDVRFSEDKSAYKTNVSGLLTPSGTKSEGAGLVYLHLDATGGFAAAGYHALSPKQLRPIREAMIERANGFDNVLSVLSDADRVLEAEDALTAMPRGFTDHAEHRHANHIKLKSLIVRQDLPKVAWTSGDVMDRVEALARDAMPLLTFAEPAR
ncbi:DUF2461 domain-containing protein [Jannaschia donghaensis]|uniref:TIGR02453 family protein n=1 Tax=Jannaschia donghaensis TaxID=420998 RepID=A0A0M6YLM7_9RHOB|nr:DUF2461 domain-containing protein [Jannaschia donghaensis]CTQ51261.1 hypothetical protein JDO7802_03300 [Jannaschia donghaensis]